MSCFVAIEGIDGSGKGTQTAALRRYFQEQGLNCETITFPRYSETLLGQQIGRFLDGRFGPLEHLHPVPISLLYAAERFESRALIEDKRNECDVLIADRYVGSNLAHQGARLQGAEREEFLAFIDRLEFELFGVPRPDLVLLLDLPAEASARRVASKRARDYTDQVADLHESNLEYLLAVREVYLELCAERPEWHKIPCLDTSGQNRDIDEIQQELREILQRHTPLQFPANSDNNTAPKVTE